MQPIDKNKTHQNLQSFVMFSKKNETNISATFCKQRKNETQ